MTSIWRPLAFLALAFAICPQPGYAQAPKEPPAIYDGSSIEDAIIFLGSQKEWLPADVKLLKEWVPLADREQVAFASRLVAVNASRDANEFRRILAPGSLALLDQQLPTGKANCAMRDMERLADGTLLPFGPDVHRLIVMCCPTGPRGKGDNPSEWADRPTHWLYFGWRDPVNHDLILPPRIPIARVGKSYRLVEETQTFSRPARPPRIEINTPTLYRLDALPLQGTLALRIVAHPEADRSRCLWVPAAPEARVSAAVTRQAANGVTEVLLCDEPNLVMLPDDSWRIDKVYMGSESAFTSRYSHHVTPLNIRLDADGSRRLQKLASDNQGRWLAVIINGKVVATPFIEKSISDLLVVTGCTSLECVESTYLAMVPSLQMRLTLLRGTFPSMNDVPGFLRPLFSRVDTGRGLCQLSYPSFELSPEQAGSLAWSFASSTEHILTVRNCRIENNSVPISDVNGPTLHIGAVATLLPTNRVALDLACSSGNRSDIDLSSSTTQTTQVQITGGACNETYVTTVGRAILIPLRQPGPPSYLLATIDIDQPPAAH